MVVPVIGGLLFELPLPLLTVRDGERRCMPDRTASIESRKCGGAVFRCSLGNGRRRPYENLRPSLFRLAGAAGGSSSGFGLRPNPIDFARAERDAE